MRRSKFWHWKFCSKMVPSLCVRLAPARGRSQSKPGSGQRVTSMRVNIRNTHVQKTLIFIYCFVTSLFLVGKVHTFKLSTFGWDINNLLCELYHSMFNLAQCFVIKVSQSDESIWQEISDWIYFWALTWIWLIKTEAYLVTLSKSFSSERNLGSLHNFRAQQLIILLSALDAPDTSVHLTTHCFSFTPSQDCRFWPWLCPSCVKKWGECWTAPQLLYQGKLLTKHCNAL